MWWILVAASADAASCAEVCKHMLACFGVTDPTEVQACVTECSLGDGTQLAAFATASCQDITAALGGLVPAPEVAAPQQAPPSAAVAPAAAGACPNPKGPGATAESVAFLTSSAWCSFSYASNVTRSSRSMFFADGRAAQDQNSESAHGNESWGVASQHGGGQQGCWRMNGPKLELSLDGQVWHTPAQQAADNGSGSIILTIDGTEYMRCQ